MPTLGFFEVLVILVLLILLFGAKKIPLIARGLGAGIRNFKGELKSDPEDEERKIQGERGPEPD
jgi:sec-independent protein translocase protein TatA